MKENKYKKENVDKILDEIKKDLKENRKLLQRAFDIDKREWEYEVNFEKLIEQIEEIKKKEYLPRFTKELIVDGIGKIALLSNSTPYLIFNFILSCIYTNNKVEVILEKKLIATNKVLIENIRSTILRLKLDPGMVTYKEEINRDRVVEYQDKYDLLYFFGNKEEYLYFIKRIHIDTKFENSGEIDVYIDNKDFKNDFISMDKFAYLNEIDIKYYTKSLEEVAKEMNFRNNINKISVIFTKDTEKAYEFIKLIKSENIYININPCEQIKYETNLENLVYRKKIIMRK